MSQEFDVIIVGGGPGGSSSAAFLSKKGFKVLLLEKAKFPRDKTCGDAISGKSTSLLRALGIQEQIYEKPHAEIHGVTFSSPSGAVVDITFDTAKGQRKGTGFVCRRYVYDNMLFENAKKQENVTVKEQFMVTDLIQEKGFVKGVKGMNLISKKLFEFKAKMVIGADGATSIIATKLGLNKIDPLHQVIAIRAYYNGIADMKDNIEIHFIEDVMPGYFWIFPLEKGLANVGVGMITKDVKERSTNLEKSMFKAIQENPLFIDRFKNAKLLGEVEKWSTPLEQHDLNVQGGNNVKGWTLPLGSTKRKCYGNGFILVGDAASLIDPFSGEGIGNAMLSAKIGAEVIEKAFIKNDFSEEFFKQYSEILWAEIGPELKTSYLLQKIGRIKPLLNLVIGKAAKSKEIKETLSGMLANENAKKAFVSPMFYLKLLFA